MSINYHTIKSLNEVERGENTKENDGMNGKDKFRNNITNKS